MAEWKLERIKLRLEYVVQADNPNAENAGADVLPHQVAVEFPLTPKVFVTDQPDSVPEDTILALSEGVDHLYPLHRLRDRVGFEFDHPGTNLSVLGGALKISFTSLDTQTGSQVTDTAYFPIEDRPANATPIGVQFKFILKQQEVTEDPPMSVYRLIHVVPSLVGIDPEAIGAAIENEIDTSSSSRIIWHSYGLSP